MKDLVGETKIVFRKFKCN